MDFIETLRNQKSEGEREWAAKQADEEQKRTEEAARARAEEELRRNADAERNRKKAADVFATLPALVKQAAARGLDCAILPDSFVEERAPQGEPHREVVFSRRTYYLKGWQLPFDDMCREHRVPLTVVTEKVDVGLKRVLHRTYAILAVDLKRL